MQSVAGAGVVVTGGGSGIGAALARRFAAEGARVVVNDLNGAAAAEVAQSCGATAAPGDAASEDGVAALVAAARDVLGEIDLYCANAGVAREDDTEASWEASWQVNVMAHVRAARLLLPRWLERGHGHLICTVSAAGLLTMLGSAPYSATKHAALAFAEWLAASYTHRGITVQALCPMGVRTAMLDATSPAAGRRVHDHVLDPGADRGAVIAGIAAGSFLIPPHPDARDVRGRAPPTYRGSGA
jgi:NAD(P)-dependent dehydrogenase (short-subunit alcohol dehydrogenase family)